MGELVVQGEAGTESSGGTGSERDRVAVDAKGDREFHCDVRLH